MLILPQISKYFSVSRVHSRHQLLSRLTITKPEEDQSLEAVTRVATVSTSCVAVVSLLEAAFYFLYNRTVRIYLQILSRLDNNNSEYLQTILFAFSFIHGLKSFRNLSQMRKHVTVSFLFFLFIGVH